MVNKPLNRAYRVRPFFIFLLLVIAIQGTPGQNLSKYYSSLQQETGTLYFIKTKHTFKQNPNKGEFIFDLTYLNSADSVTLNFSFTTATIYTINSITIVTPGVQHTSSTSHLFTEPDKRLWQHRYSCSFTFNELDSFFKSNNTGIIIHTNKETFTLYCSNKNWEKQSGIITKIFSMIEVNR